MLRIVIWRFEPKWKTFWDEAIFIFLLLSRWSFAAKGQ
jgi:hypothetical protein